MFKRLNPLVINGREITDPLTVQLSERMTEARAVFVAGLRVDRGFTWRMASSVCGRAWGERQDFGAALREPAAARFGEDASWLDFG